MTERVFDASTVLAFLRRERGWDAAERELRNGGLVGAVNVVEILTKRIDDGLPPLACTEEFADLRLTVVAFDGALPELAAALRGKTRHRGLSLGDRACLALAIARGLPVITADRAWEGLDLGVPIEVVR